MLRKSKKFSLILAIIVLCQLFYVIPVFSESLFGDLNGDNSVDSIDYALLKTYLLYTRAPSGDNWMEHADVYRDGEINSLDLAILKKYLLGMTKSLPFNPEGNDSQPTPTFEIPVTPTPKEDWIPFVPPAENVSLKLVIDNSYQTGANQQKYIQVEITFNDGGYRIADEGKLECTTSQSGELYFYTSGVKIEKYVGSGGVTMALMHKVIKYPVENQLGDKNRFDFKVYDKIVTGFSFTTNSVIMPEPITYDAEVNEKFVNANAQFAADLFQKFSKDDLEENVFFSPFSISMALSMAYQGADTTTKDAMAEALNYKGMTDDEINQSYRAHLDYFKKLYPQIELDVANSIWIKKNSQIKESFLNKNNEVFDAYSSFLDFSSPEACDIMNKWISDATKGKINNVIKSPIQSNIVLYLMNAIYFNGSWTDKFDITQTTNSYFTNIKGEKELVPMMNRTGKYKYAQTSEYRAVEIPYGSRNVSMYCILPEKDNVNDFISQFDNNKWNEVKSKLSMRSNVRLSIPRFKIEYEPGDIIGKLTELGMGEAFSYGADFSGISDNAPWIGDIKHKAVIDVNEKGTEASVITTIGMATPSIPDAFTANKPFMFVIADNVTGSILFMGKVVSVRN
ncbi:MAG TPA: serpin family protein [Acetivibrio clariflavus]|nr:serpin family protein [Acetivibrio clariflavus]